MIPLLSEATTLNVSFLPSIAVRVASACMVSPCFVGRTCVEEIKEPTVVSPSCNVPFTAFMAAFSMSESMTGVPSTGRSPLPIFIARWRSSTVISLVYFNPVSIFLFFLFVREWFASYVALTGL